jgi:hypothetical protein
VSWGRRRWCRGGADVEGITSRRSVVVVSTLETGACEEGPDKRRPGRDERRTSFERGPQTPTVGFRPVVELRASSPRQPARCARHA